jgi:hypothetical protein
LAESLPDAISIALNLELLLDYEFHQLKVKKIGKFGTSPIFREGSSSADLLGFAARSGHSVVSETQHWP